MSEKEKEKDIIMEMIRTHAIIIAKMDLKLAMLTSMFNAPNMSIDKRMEEESRLREEINEALFVTNQRLPDKSILSVTSPVSDLRITPRFLSEKEIHGEYVRGLPLLSRIKRLISRKTNK